MEIKREALSDKDKEFHKEDFSIGIETPPEKDVQDLIDHSDSKKASDTLEMKDDQTKIECKCTDHLEKLEAEVEYPISAKKLFDMLFDEKSTIWDRLHQKKGNTLLHSGPWVIDNSEDGERKRELKFIMPISNPLLAAMAGLAETVADIIELLSTDVENEIVSAVLPGSPIRAHGGYSPTLRRRPHHRVPKNPSEYTNWLLDERAKCNKARWLLLKDDLIDENEDNEDNEDNLDKDNCDNSSIINEQTNYNRANTTMTGKEKYNSEYKTILKYCGDIKKQLDVMPTVL
ncbi:1071_t:CDS:2 [Racocetra fulgida]|uniref:1071_t:CDS:1 n=1 Tax=Racocetra fulgida TaxID=60492 RepID=A0A9N8ZGB1_9GLOM|nr:1071_t:CDS:2 [Racocetra fulgida]